MKNKRQKKYYEQKELVRNVISDYLEAFSLEDNLHHKRHKNNIRCGKLIGISNLSSRFFKKSKSRSK